MTKRKLTKEEKEIYEKRIKIYEKDKNIFLGEIKRIEFNLDFLLEHNYNKRINELNSELRGYKNKLKELESTLSIMKQHLMYGVEKKEKKESEQNE